ncbi:hypothetical protein ABWW58_15480 [Sporolactobacillus sp. STCC-11]|uniref:hypothetical protein n=1 Tax=Sporolactobacillus caesalpiniae TaxID=3230362 RepID=UPI00339B235E
MRRFFVVFKRFSLVVLILALYVSMSGISPRIAKADGGADSTPDYSGHKSWNQLTTSNGLSAAIYSAGQRKLVRYQPHIYSHYDDKSTTLNYMWDSYFGYSLNGGKGTWLSDVHLDSAKYVNGTNIINAVQKDNGLAFNSYYFTPFSGDNQNQSNMLVMLMKVTNTSDVDKEVSVFSTQNMHLGTDYGTNDEQTSYNSNKQYIKEFNGSNGNIAIYKNLNRYGAHYETGSSDQTPWADVRSNGKLYDRTQDKGNDLSVGFENRSNDLAAGESKWYGVIIGLTEKGNESQLGDDVEALAEPALDISPEALLNQEKDWWANWHSKEKMPAGLSDQEQQVYKQSTAVLKMAQVRESGKGYGQVLASLIPGEWSIGWVRDGIYSIQALIESGHYQEARNALKFMFEADMRKTEDGKDNYYQKHYIESTDKSVPTYGLGVDLSDDYLISLCRFFGNGTEDSDPNENGYNIEFDGWGLALWGAERYVAETGDTAFLNEFWPKLKARDANLLEELIDKDTGLMQPDSSIWEEHWTPFDVRGNAPARQQFAFTNITTYQGFKSAARLASLAGDQEGAARFTEDASKLKTAILDHLVVDTNGAKTIASSLERKSDPAKFNDGSTVEAIHFGLVDPSSDLAKGMINAYDQNLRIKTGSTPGYMRNQDGDTYDSREWGFIDLRIAGALAKMGRDDQSKVLLDWMTSTATANYDLIPELLDWTTQDYAGSVPMAGFGSGSYVLGINDYYGQQTSKPERAATDAVEKAEASKTQADVDAARALVDKLTAGDVKTDLENRLNAVQKLIDQAKAEDSATHAVEKAETSKDQADVDAARALVQKLSDGTVKTELTKRLDVMQNQIDESKAEKAAAQAVEKAEKSKNQTDVDAARALVQKLSNETVKTELVKRLDAVQQQIDGSKSEEAAIKAVQKAGVVKTQKSIDQARTLVERLPDGKLKSKLTKKLNKIQKIVDRRHGIDQATDAVQVAAKSLSQKDVNTARNLVNQLPSGAVKKALLQHLSAIQKKIDRKAVLYTGYLTKKHALYKGSSVHAKILKKLPAGTVVKVLKTGKWTKVRYQGFEGYIWGKDVKKVVFKGKLVNPSAFRSGSSKKAHIIKYLKKNTHVNVLVKGKSWDRIVYGGKIGSVWSKDIKNK